VDRQTQLISRPWADWLAALLTRAGGSGEQLTNADLAALVTSLTASVQTLTARTHLLGGPLTPPSVVPVAAGAGDGATASVSGNDNAGTITLSVAALAERRSNSEVLRLTFAAAWTAAPIVVISAANNAAWSLYYGRFLRHGHPASVRLLQDAVTETSFALSVGVTSLPREAAVYQWNFLAVG
jgi:hypothetical protein